MIDLINGLITDIEQTVGGALSVIFADMASFAPTLFVLVLLIYVFVIGLMLIVGLSYPINRFLLQILLFIVLYAFATQYDMIALPLYELVTGWVSDFATLRGTSFGDSIVTLLIKITRFCDLASDQMPWGTRSMAYVFLALVILVPALIMLGILFMSYLTVIVIAAVVIALLPILFIFGMFSATRDMLFSGLRLVMQYLLLGLLSILMLNFVATIFSQLEPEILTKLNQDDFPLFYIAAFYGLIVYLFLLITLQLPNLAASIAGGLATNVGHLPQNIAGMILGFSRQLANQSRRAVQYRGDGSSRITRNAQGIIRGSGRFKKVGQRFRKISKKSTWR